MLKRYLLPVLLLSLWNVIVLHAQVPRTISYQGLLTDATGAFVPDGAHLLELALYDQATGGTVLFTETQAVVVVNGLFNAIIGSTSPLPTTLSFDRAYFLGVKVDNGAELSPRTPLTAVPYALRAAVATTAEGLKPGATGVVTSINGLSGDVQLVGGGSTSINRSGSTLTISSSGSGGSGMQGLQNNDGALTITNASGPVATIDVAPQGITTAMLADNAVTTAKLGVKVVTTEKIAPNAVNGEKLMDSSVTTKKIADSSITMEKLAATVKFPPGGNAGGALSGTYPNPSLTQNAVTETKIADDAVTGSKLAANSVTSAKIVDGTITGSDVNTTAALLIASLKASGGAVIGSQSATGARLVVRGSGVTSASAAMSVTDSLGASLLYVRDDGRVGIGTSTPGAALEVSGPGIGLNISAGSAIVSNAALGGGGGVPVFIPANTTAITITNDGVVAPIALTLPPGVPGQILIILNTDPDPVVVPPIATGQARMYIFLAGAWRVIT